MARVIVGRLGCFEPLKLASRRWLRAGPAVFASGAVAAMVGFAWWRGTVLGPSGYGGDFVGHAAAAEWFRGLAWWDWRGWSDWFYGGQAMGVNYPPLSHAWLRLTDPLHGQFAAVAVGLLVVLPWAVRSMARALRVRTSPATWAVLYTLLAFAGGAHWLFPGFHLSNTGFGSWPAMIAALLGVVCVARAFELSRPVSTGVVAGVSVLFNSTVVPGVIVLVLVVLLGGRRGLAAARWAALVGSVALATSGWWLVSFLHGWSRLVPWRLSLRSALSAGDDQHLLVVVLAVVSLASLAWLGGRCRWLALAAAVVTLAAGLADAAGYLRTERWVTPAAVVAMALCALGAPGLLRAVAGRASAQLGGADDSPAAAGPPPADRTTGFSQSLPVDLRRSPARCLAAAMGAAGAVLVGVWALVPVTAWVLWHRRWAVVRYGAPAWAALLIAVPAAGLFSPPERFDTAPSAAMTLTHGADEPNVGGFVYLQETFEHARGGTGNCAWGDPWRIIAADGVRLRPLTGLYRETSAPSEFIDINLTGSQDLRLMYDEPIDQWAHAWDAAPPGAPINHETAARALGADWYVFCDSTDTITARRLDAPRAGGVALSAHAAEDAWHRDAVGWWAGLLTGEYDLEDAEAAVPTHGSVDWDAYPPGQAATGVSLLEAGESFATTAEAAGWAWVRIPWDPYWHSHDGTPVLKGGPGHIVAWIDEGQNNYGWWVPRRVDIAAIATTTTAAALALTLLITGRRRSAADPWSRSPTLNCRPTAPQPAEPDRGASPAANPTRHKINDYFSKSIETVS